MANMKTAMKREKQQMAGKLAAARANIGRLFRAGAALYTLVDIQPDLSFGVKQYAYTVYSLDTGQLEYWNYYDLYINLPSAAWVSPPRPESIGQSTTGEKK